MRACHHSEGRIIKNKKIKKSFHRPGEGCCGNCVLNTGHHVSGEWLLGPSCLPALLSEDGYDYRSFELGFQPLLPPSFPSRLSATPFLCIGLICPIEPSFLTDTTDANIGLCGARVHDGSCKISLCLSGLLGFAWGQAKRILLVLLLGAGVVRAVV